MEPEVSPLTGVCARVSSGLPRQTGTCMRVLIAICVLACLAGCVADQARVARPDASLDAEAVNQSVMLHGSAGYSISAMFQGENIASKMRDTTGQARGLVGTEFFHVQIAPDATQPTALTTVGYIRRLEEDRGDLLLYEFYDKYWNRLAILGIDGDLYRVDARGSEHLGRFQLEDAAKHLYQPPSGYGYDTVAQDQARVRGWDPEVGSADPRARGVHHRTHRSAPPVIVMVRLRAGEVALLAERYAPERYNDAELELLNRLRAQRHGDVGIDEEYGGIQYKDGQPVDSMGRPLYRGAIKD